MLVNSVRHLRSLPSLAFGVTHSGSPSSGSGAILAPTLSQPSIFAGRRAHDEDWEGVEARIAPLPEEGEPEWVTPKARLGRDLRCLMELTSTEAPPRIMFRVAAQMMAFYMPGDASGSGFGSAIIKDKVILYQAGTWTSDWRVESSNYREADNLVLRLEVMVEQQCIRATRDARGRQWYRWVPGGLEVYQS